MSRATDPANLNQHAHFKEGVTGIQKVNHATRGSIYEGLDPRSAFGNTTPRPASPGRTARLSRGAGVYGQDQRRAFAPPWSRSDDGRCPPRPFRCGHGVGVRQNRPIGKTLPRRVGRTQPPNIEYVSFRENLDTGGPLGRAIGAIAELERNLIIERMRAGMRRARLEGQHIGRHPLQLDHETIHRERCQGQSLRQIAKGHRISTATVQRVLKKRTVQEQAPDLMTKSA